MQNLEINKEISIICLGLKNRNIILRVVDYIRLIFYLKGICRNEKFDFIIGTTHALSSLVSLVKTEGKKIGWEHRIYDDCPRLSRIIRKFCYKSLDGIIILAKSEEDKYDFIENSKKFIIPNILSFKCNRPSELNEKVIVSAGRLCKEKRYDILINCAKVIKLYLPDWEIHIYGEGDYKRILEEQIKSLELEEYVKLMGVTNNIKSVLLKSSIMVMTSEHECLPMILIEGQACGLPIVSFDCPVGPRNIISEGQNGFLIPMDDVSLFVKRIVQIATDHRLRRQLADHAYNTSLYYRAENIYSLWKLMLNRL